MSFWQNLFGAVPATSISEVQDKLKERPGPVLLDVRSTEEYRNGHIPGAVSIPLDKLPERMSSLARGREIVCICQSGSRSRSATKQLKNAGYTAVNLQGGMSAWVKAGQKVKAGKVK